MMELVGDGWTRDEAWGVRISGKGGEVQVL